MASDLDPCKIRFVESRSLDFIGDGSSAFPGLERLEQFPGLERLEQEIETSLTYTRPMLVRAHPWSAIGSIAARIERIPAIFPIWQYLKRLSDTGSAVEPRRSFKLPDIQIYYQNYGFVDGILLEGNTPLNVPAPFRAKEEERIRAPIDLYTSDATVADRLNTLQGASGYQAIANEASSLLTELALFLSKPLSDYIYFAYKIEPYCLVDFELTNALVRELYDEVVARPVIEGRKLTELWKRNDQSAMDLVRTLVSFSSHGSAMQKDPASIRHALFGSARLDNLNNIVEFAKRRLCRLESIEGNRERRSALSLFFPQFDENLIHWALVRLNSIKSELYHNYGDFASEFCELIPSYNHDERDVQMVHEGMIKVMEKQLQTCDIDPYLLRVAIEVMSRMDEDTSHAAELTLSILETTAQRIIGDAIKIPSTALEFCNAEQLVIGILKSGYSDGCLYVEGTLSRYSVLGRVLSRFANSIFQPSLFDDPLNRILSSWWVSKWGRSFRDSLKSRDETSVRSAIFSLAIELLDVRIRNVAVAAIQYVGQHSVYAESEVTEEAISIMLKASCRMDCLNYAFQVILGSLHHPHYGKLAASRIIRCIASQSWLIPLLRVDREAGVWLLWATADQSLSESERISLSWLLQEDEELVERARQLEIANKQQRSTDIFRCDFQSFFAIRTWSIEKYLQIAADTPLWTTVQGLLQAGVRIDFQELDLTQLSDIYTTQFSKIFSREALELKRYLLELRECQKICDIRFSVSLPRDEALGPQRGSINLPDDPILYFLTLDSAGYWDFSAAEREDSFSEYGYSYWKKYSKPAQFEVHRAKATWKLLVLSCKLSNEIPLHHFDAFLLEHGLSNAGVDDETRRSMWQYYNRLTKAFADKPDSESEIISIITSPKFPHFLSILTRIRITELSLHSNEIREAADDAFSSFAQLARVYTSIFSAVGEEVIELQANLRFVAALVAGIAVDIFRRVRSSRLPPGEATIKNEFLVLKEIDRVVPGLRKLLVSFKEILSTTTGTSEIICAQLLSVTEFRVSAKEAYEVIRVAQNRGLDLDALKRSRLLLQMSLLGFFRRAGDLHNALICIGELVAACNDKAQRLRACAFILEQTPLPRKQTRFRTQGSIRREFKYMRSFFESFGEICTSALYEVFRESTTQKRIRIASLYGFGAERELLPAGLPRGKELVDYIMSRGYPDSFYTRQEPGDYIKSRSTSLVSTAFEKLNPNDSIDRELFASSIGYFSAQYRHWTHTKDWFDTICSQVPRKPSLLVHKAVLNISCADKTSPHTSTLSPDAQSQLFELLTTIENLSKLNEYECVAQAVQSELNTVRTEIRRISLSRSVQTSERVASRLDLLHDAEKEMELATDVRELFGAACRIELAGLPKVAARLMRHSILWSIASEEETPRTAFWAKEKSKGIVDLLNVRSMLLEGLARTKTSVLWEGREKRFVELARKSLLSGPIRKAFSLYMRSIQSTKDSGHIELEIIPDTHGLLTRFAGFISDTCLVRDTNPLRHVKEGLFIAFHRKQTKKTIARFDGGAFLIKAELNDGTMGLLVRGFNPGRDLLAKVQPMELFERFLDFVHSHCGSSIAHVLIPDDASCGCGFTNSETCFHSFKERYRNSVTARLSETSCKEIATIGGLLVEGVRIVRSA